MKIDNNRIEDKWAVSYFLLEILEQSFCFFRRIIRGGKGKKKEGINPSIYSSSFANIVNREGER